MKCPRCDNGQLFNEDCDEVCLQCGYRRDATMTETNPSHVGGPFDRAVSALQQALDTARSDMAKAETMARRRKAEVRRIEASLRVLTAEKNQKRPGGPQTPEAKAAAAERIRKMNEARRQQREEAAATA